MLHYKKKATTTILQIKSPPIVKNTARPRLPIPVGLKLANKTADLQFTNRLFGRLKICCFIMGYLNRSYYLIIEDSHKISSYSVI